MESENEAEDEGLVGVGILSRKKITWAQSAQSQVPLAFIKIKSLVMLQKD